ncbi:DUF1289 domain-containing protein [Pseudomonas sp. 21LCFQ02]|uniref:DUF1289 domain-containing protein n=1 Tax=unclassified Pseudomonas TaxID=196821 RepID=UPI0005EDC72E|nr:MULTISPECIES: DUF1289 domain-containing protein [unclassified Pseudomonas]MCO8169314.1 DUF1289 domain-containing protein [Pseudomonas sp. 21LCFQ02]MCQ9424023.1 DUF1289 domain-containing protein [Pseudomonas sp. LJDD11]
MSSSKNPCISLCKFDADICLGCGRSKKEIKAWKKLDKDQRSEILSLAKKRMSTLKGAGRRKKK